MSPMPSYRSNSSTSLFPPIPAVSNSTSDDDDNKKAFPNITTAMTRQQQQSEIFPPTPSTPTASNRRIERFVNKISHMGNNNNQFPDPAKQSARTAKLKVEVVDAGNGRKGTKINVGSKNTKVVIYNRYMDNY